jgi:hypothetical protein
VGRSTELDYSIDVKLTETGCEKQATGSGQDPMAGSHVQNTGARHVFTR